MSKCWIFLFTSRPPLCVIGYDHLCMTLALPAYQPLRNN